MVKISVIIPVFNGGKYLSTCLESVANQAVKDMEIIIIDNGSTDNSIQVIEAFINRWKVTRNIIFLHEAKQGNAYARNTGLAHASGEYIAFVDQDDRVKEDFLSYLYVKAKELDADVITSGYKAVFANGFTKRRMRLKQCEWAPYRMVSPWGKLYKRSLIEENSIRFLTVNKGEDVYFVFQAYNHAKNMAVVSAVGYKWFSNSKSFSHTEHRKINDDNSIIPLFDVLQNSVYPLKNIDKDYLEYFYIKTIVHEAVFCAKGKDFKTSYGYYEKLRDWIDENYPDNEKNKYVGVMSPRGEEIKRRIFVAWFWSMKRRNTVDKFLKAYTRLFI